MATNLFRVGCGATDTASELKSIAAAPTGADRYMTLESPVGTDYVVPVGKSFYITRLIINTDTASTGVKIGYGDNGVADGAAAPTNFVQLTEQFRAVLVGSNTIDMFAVVPTGKYPCVRQNASASTANYITILGLEI